MSSVPALGATDFPAFYRSIHDRKPFRWQSDLVEQVLADRRWPDLIDVPTGLGKTSMLDVAVFVAAATAVDPAESRPGRRRCFFVVDRRIVVDEAYDHARHLAARIADAEGRDDVLGRVAAGLRTYAPEVAGELLPVTRMRGGTTWAAAWLDRPDRPAIVLGTVDQIGSRLLFRGYGVSDLRRPLDAALVGTDSLVLVDEAHLSTALVDTVTALRQRDRLGVPLPGLDLVRLTATGAPTQQPFVFDVDRHRGDPVARQRLTAAKRLTVQETSAKDCVEILAQTTLDGLRMLAGSPSPQAPVALVVCNTVDRARAVHDRIGRLLVDPRVGIEADHQLLIGRTRPLGRPDLQQRVLTRFGVDRVPADRAAILVATQTVEVGVNLDVDILVTESASWDAIVQRLGRLNRLGRLRDRFPARPAATAVVVHDGQIDGPVYGTARDETWRVLQRLANDAVKQGYDGVDVSPLGCLRLKDEKKFAEGCYRRPDGVPVLLTPTLDAWVQTAPVPLVDPPIEPFLHGFGGGVAAVQVLWRAGLLASDPTDDPWSEDEADLLLSAPEIEARLAQWPPRTSEIVEVPFVAVRQWMRGEAPQPVDDLESAPEVEGRARRVREQFEVLAQRPTRAASRPAAVVESALAWRWIDAEALRPGDRIVVPVEHGGLDAFGWAPKDEHDVVDVAEVTTFTESRSRRPAALRLDAGLPVRLGLGETDASRLRGLLGRLVEVEGDAALRAVAREMADVLPDVVPEDRGWTADTWPRLHRWLSGGELEVIEVTDPSDQWIVDETGPRVWERILVGPVPDEHDESSEVRVTGDDEEPGTSSGGTQPVPLSVHHRAVRERAGTIATALRFPPDFRAVLEDAAGWHDLGKVEERFQAMLHEGDAYEAALAVEPLAKSGMDSADRMAFRRARQRSGLPAGTRHEAWSAALVEEYVRAHDYPGDVDLLVHLVSSHHGYARPWPRLVVDSEPRTVEAIVDGHKVTVSSDRTVSLDQPARFARLNERYGRWGLALLEAVLRCADVTVSEEGS